MMTLNDILQDRIKKCEEDKEQALRDSRYWEMKFKNFKRKILSRVEKNKDPIKAVIEIEKVLDAENHLDDSKSGEGMLDDPVKTDTSRPSETPKAYFDFSFQVVGVGQKSADFIGDAFIEAVEKKRGHAYGGYNKVKEEDKNDT